MTFAPPTLRAARALLVDNLDMHPGTGSYPADLDPAEVGIVGDRPHVDGGVSYHLGEDDLDMSSNPYSVRTARDRAGLSDAASAVDIGEFRITTELGTFTHRDFAVWLVRQCQANAPDTRDVREVIYSPDGTRVLRYDRERGYASAPREGEADTTHRTHNHASMYRDAEFRYSLYNLVRRWLTEIGVIDMADTVGDTAAQYRLMAVVTLDPTWANRKEIVEGARLTSVPLIDLLRRVDTSTAKIAGLVTTVNLLAEALNNGGVNLDTAAVLARIDERAAEDVERDTAQARRIEELETKLAAAEEREAASARAAADAYGAGGTAP